MLLIGWLAFDDNSDWLWLAVDETNLNNGQFWQGYTLSSRTSRFFYQGWSSNCLLISTKLEVLLLELSTLHLSRVCSTLVKCLWACSLDGKLKQVKKYKTLDPAYAQNLHDALTEGCSTSTADVDAWEAPCCSRHVVITQRGRLHQSGNRLKQFLLQFLSG